MDTLDLYRKRVAFILKKDAEAREKASERKVRESLITHDYQDYNKKEKDDNGRKD